MTRSRRIIQPRIGFGLPMSRAATMSGTLLLSMKRWRLAFSGGNLAKTNCRRGQNKTGSPGLIVPAASSSRMAWAP